MDQKKFSLEQSIKRRKRWQASAVACIHLELDDELFLQALKKAHQEKENEGRMIMRRNQIRSINFNLNALSELQLMKDFRFLLPEINKISVSLGWSGVTMRNSYVCEPVLACALFLYRLATITRWFECETKFGMYTSHMSEVYWEIIELVNNKWGKLLDLRGPYLKERSESYAESIRQSGSSLEKCVGFIDCTKIRMARPGGRSSLQKACYSGHKRFHCLSYQTLTTPDGLIFALYGPIEGRRHDLTLLRKSGWSEILESNLSNGETQYYVYGDGAYDIRPWLQRPFRGHLNAAQRQFNQGMSSVRVSVEHNYKDLKQQWSSQDYARKLMVRKCPIALSYKACAIMWNIRTCFYRSGQVTERFNTTPPSFQEYTTGLV